MFGSFDTESFPLLIKKKHVTHVVSDVLLYKGVSDC